MKKFLLMALIAAFVTTGTYAQDQGDHKQARAQWEQKVKDELKLTPEQTVSFDSIASEYNQKFDALMSDTTTDKSAVKDQKMSLKAEMQTKINAILTPEQQATYKSLIDAKKDDDDSGS